MQRIMTYFAIVCFSSILFIMYKIRGRSPSQKSAAQHKVKQNAYQTAGLNKLGATPGAPTTQKGVSVRREKSQTQQKTKQNKENPIFVPFR